MREELLGYIDELIERYDDDEMEQSEDPMSDSGGNFDDAYYMGIEFGEMCGKLEVLHEIKSFLTKGDE
ncbi:hypothetical protein EEL32_10230 [Brevibacillus laterosporus]|nr:hypothetical protein [Brevibacillus laterosporus]TPG88132.1 hypothetical protein EEL32_10230 [Brevibacillus laterosporus]